VNTVYCRVVVHSDNPIGYWERYRDDGYCADGAGWVFAEEGRVKVMDRDDNSVPIFDLFNVRVKVIQRVFEMMWHYAEDSFDRGYYFRLPDKMLIYVDGCLNDFLGYMPLVGRDNCVAGV